MKTEDAKFRIKTRDGSFLLRADRRRMWVGTREEAQAIVDGWPGDEAKGLVHIVRVDTAQ